MGTASLVQGINKFAGAINDMARYQHREDERKVGLAEINLRQAGQRASVGTKDEPGYLGSQGEHAIEGYERAVEALDKRRDDILAGLTPSQRNIAEVPLRAYTQEVAGTWAEHREKQRVKHSDAIAEAQLRAVVQDVNHTHDPFDQTLHEGTLAHASDIIAKRGAERGESPEVVQGKVRSFKQQMSLARVVAAVKANPRNALRLWNQAKRTVPVKDWEATEKMVLTRARGALVQEVIHRMEPLETAAARHAFAATLTEDKLLSLLGPPMTSATGAANKAKRDEQAKDTTAAIQVMHPKNRKAQTDLARTISGLGVREQVLLYLKNAHDAENSSLVAATDDLVTQKSRNLYRVGAIRFEDVKRVLARDEGVQAFPKKMRDKLVNLVHKRVMELSGNEDSAEVTHYKGLIHQGFDANQTSHADRLMAVNGPLGRELAAKNKVPEHIRDAVLRGVTADLNRTTAGAQDVLALTKDVTDLDPNFAKIHDTLVVNKVQADAAKAAKQEKEAEEAKANGIAKTWILGLVKGEVTLKELQDKSPEVWSEFQANHPKKADRIEKAEKARINGGYASETNQDTLRTLDTMPWPKFLKVDLEQQKPNLSQADYKSLQARQREGRIATQEGKRQGPLVQAGLDHLKRTASGDLLEAIKKPEDADPDIQRAVRYSQEEISKFVSLNPNATEIDVRNFVSSELTTTVSLRDAGWFGRDHHVSAAQAAVRDPSTHSGRYIDPTRTSDPVVAQGFQKLTPALRNRLSENPRQQTAVAQLFLNHRTRDWPTYMATFLRNRYEITRVSRSALSQLTVLRALHEAGDPKAMPRADALIKTLKQRQGAKK